MNVEATRATLPPPGRPQHLPQRPDVRANVEEKLSNLRGWGQDRMAELEADARRLLEEAGDDEALRQQVLDTLKARKTELHEALHERKEGVLSAIREKLNAPGGPKPTGVDVTA